MTWNYSKKTTELFMAAVQGKPGTHLGEIEDPDGFGEHGSIACGDALRFTFRVDRDPADPLKDRISEARYLTFGCNDVAVIGLVRRGRRLPGTARRHVIRKGDHLVLEGAPELPEPGPLEAAEGMKRAFERYLEKGITSVGDALVDPAAMTGDSP